MVDKAPTRDADPRWKLPALPEPQLLSLGDLLVAVQRSFWTIAACVLAMVALATVYVIVTPARYVAGAQLLIEPAKRQLLWPNSNVVDLTDDNAEIESQVEVLHSEEIANNVITALHLANDPEFRSKSARSAYERQRITLARFMDALSTRRIGRSFVIEVSFRAADPVTASRIVNAITATYIREQLRAKAAVARQASEWMQQRVTELGFKLNAAAAAAQKFRAENGITDNGNLNQERLLDKLTELEARAQAYRKLYEGFVQKLVENRQQESYPVSDARVISAASPPLARSSPKVKLVLALAVLLGLIAGGAIAAARSMLDGTVRAGKQIRQALGLDCFAALPRLRLGDRNGEAAFRQVLDRPLSPFAEAMRGLKISLQNGAGPRAGLRIGVISLRRGEGRTTVAIGVAALFAAAGSKALLIDADFRDPALSRRLAPGARRGLPEPEALGDPGSAVVFDPKTATHVLLAANSGPLPGTADLLGSSRMRELLRQLESSFATIVVDLPSLEFTAEARAIGPLLDGCILVTEWGRTPIDALREAVELLQASRVRVLGAVINKVEPGIPPLFGRRIAGRRRADRRRYPDRSVAAESP